MEVASQARVTKQGGGEATVLNTSNFYNQMYNVQKDIIAQREKKKKEYEQQQKTWNTLAEDMPDVWQADYDHVNKAVEEYNDFVIDLKTQGIDPDTMDSVLLKKMRGLENNIRKATSAAKDNEAYYNQNFNILNQDKQNKYNKDHATKWLRDYADPNKTPQDRSKMRNESNPFKLNYDLIEFVEQTIPEPEIDETPKKKVTQRNKEAHRGIVLDYVMNDPKGQEIYESLMKPGETQEMFAERVSEEGQKKYPTQTVVKDTSKKSSGSGSGSGKIKPKVKVKNKDGDAAYDQTLVYNKVLLDNNPPVYVKDNDGNRVADFVPSGGFKIRPDGTVDVVGEGKREDDSTVEVTISYDNNKDQFDIKGYPDMSVAFKDAKQGGGTSKAIDRSQIATKAQASGYSEAEYEALLKKNGVTINEGK